MNETTIVESEAGYLSDEFLAQREAAFVPRASRVFGGCGDDRPLTAKSAAALTAAYADKHVLNPGQGYASVYGGLSGIVKNVMVVALMQDSAFLEKAGGIDGVTQTLIDYLKNDESEAAIYWGLHSAEADEKDENGTTDGVTFCAHGHAVTGCAYCGGFAITSALISSSPDLQNVARHNQVRIFGDDQYFDAFVDSHRALVDAIGQGYAVDRDAYSNLLGQGVPFMMLEGDHTGARGSGLILNFKRDSIGSARKAHDADMDIYREDIAIAAETALKAFSAYKLSPELLLRAFAIDSVAVRAVLVSNDTDPALTGKLDPKPLAVGVRGNPHDAMRELANL